jgi:hypothetical protein
MAPGRAHGYLPGMSEGTPGNPLGPVSIFVDSASGLLEGTSAGRPMTLSEIVDWTQQMRGELAPEFLAMIEKALDAEGS